MILNEVLKSEHVFAGAGNYNYKGSHSGMISLAWNGFTAYNGCGN